MANKAIELLLARRAELVANIKELQRELRDIDALLEASGETTKSHLPSVQPGQYRDNKAADAAKSYLSLCGEGMFPVQQIADALKSGGCEPNWKRKWEHNFKITLKNNAGEDKLFKYDARKQVVGLRPEFIVV